MNLHCPQDVQSAIELWKLAAVPYQIISPASNTAIIGIYQDSMIGSYLFTRQNINFKPQDAMKLLMFCNHIDENKIKHSGKISSFEILSQIIPPISMKYKTKVFDEKTEKYETSNGVVEIRNGQYVRGLITKGVLGETTRGLIQRICNDYGNHAAAQFIDNLQLIITEYMKMHSFSVGISDLIADNKTNEEILKIISQKKNDVKLLIDQTKLGVFESNAGRSNIDEFELQVNNIANSVLNETGKIGVKSLSKSNRFVMLVSSGSKGSDTNISQMISCVGQQNVEGKRIPYGFEDRTLPHFTKFDDSMSARGFVESSYVNGMSPHEVFFAAMGGRIGLIDTAVKTSSTGYIQRRLIKAMEDLMVWYDMTVRNSKGTIIQFGYGGDHFDSVKVENQPLPLLKMGIQEIFEHYLYADDKDVQNLFTKDALNSLKKQKSEFNSEMDVLVGNMIQLRNDIIHNVFNNKMGDVVHCAVAFNHIISNISGQLNITANSISDISLLDAYRQIQQCYSKLESIHYAQPTLLFKALFYYYLSPKELIVIKRFNKAGLALLLNMIELTYMRAIVAPGEMVGVIAGQSIGEASTQMTLNTFHMSGISSKSNVTTGVPRLEEILSLSGEGKDIKQPSITVCLKREDETQKEKAIKYMHMLELTRLKDVIKLIEVCYDPDNMNTLIKEDVELMRQYFEFQQIVNDCLSIDNTNDSEMDENVNHKWVIRLEMDKEAMLEKNITMDDIYFAIVNTYERQNIASCIYSDYNADKLIFRIKMNNIIKETNAKGVKKLKVNPLDQSDHIYILDDFKEKMLNDVVLKGVKNIKNVNLRKTKDNVVEDNGVFKQMDAWVLDTVGTNLLDVLALDYIDVNRTYSNDIMEMYDVLGIEACRQSIYNETVNVVEFDGAYRNQHHYSVLADRMCYSYHPIAVSRHGLNKDDIYPIAKASFEETPEQFLRASRHAELEVMRGVSSNVMSGQLGHYGTSAFQVMLDMDEMRKLSSTSEYKYVDPDEEIEKFFDEPKEDMSGECGINTITIQNNVANIPSANVIIDEEYDMGF
jgi:DNA-directed RNA polymerase II subunit RPB1